MSEHDSRVKELLVTLAALAQVRPIGKDTQDVCSCCGATCITSDGFYNRIEIDNPALKAHLLEVVKEYGTLHFPNLNEPPKRKDNSFIVYGGGLWLSTLRQHTINYMLDRYKDTGGIGKIVVALNADKEKLQEWFPEKEGFQYKVHTIPEGHAHVIWKDA